MFDAQFGQVYTLAVKVYKLFILNAVPVALAYHRHMMCRFSVRKEFCVVVGGAAQHFGCDWRV